MKIAVRLSLYRQAPRFVPAGQSTQMIIGATLEIGLSDYEGDRESV